MRTFLIVVAIGVAVLGIAACDHGLRIVLDKGCEKFIGPTCPGVDEEGARASRRGSAPASSC